MLKKYRTGKLHPLKAKRDKSAEFIVVEEKFIQYIRVRTEKLKQDKFEVSWALLEEKLLDWVKHMGMFNFRSFCRRTLHSFYAHVFEDETLIDYFICVPPYQ